MSLETTFESNSQAPIDRFAGENRDCQQAEFFDHRDGSEEFITRPYMVYRAGPNRVSFQLGNKGRVESIWVSQ